MSSGRRLYVGKVAPNATREDVEDLFNRSGKVVDVRLNQGYAFLEYAELQDAEAAVRDLHGADLLGERVTVEYARPPRPREDRQTIGGERGGYDDRGYDRGAPAPPRARAIPTGIRLVISGAPEGTSWQDVKDFVRGENRPVTYAVMDRDGKGYVEVLNRDDADDAIRQLDGQELKGVRVTVEEAAPGTGPSREYHPPRRDRFQPYGAPPPRDFNDRRGGRGDDYGRRDYGRDNYRRDDRRDDYRRDDRDRRDDRRDDYRRRSPSPRRRSPSPRRRSPSPRRDRDRSPVRDRR
ncbi:hypothetical protein OIO90_005923 [Microbotryomycetes sp. JL221]|nr:hypothetical protein OIO90_005923 [Microbotryomycetes sp. JL221]